MSVWDECHKIFLSELAALQKKEEKERVKQSSTQWNSKRQIPSQRYKQKIRSAEFWGMLLLGPSNCHLQG